MVVEIALKNGVVVIVVVAATAAGSCCRQNFWLRCFCRGRCNRHCCLETALEKWRLLLSSPSSFEVVVVVVVVVVVGVGDNVAKGHDEISHKRNKRESRGGDGGAW